MNQSIEAVVRERPILFSGPMVKAILAGRKTVTRRVVKPQPRYTLIPSRHVSTGWFDGDYMDATEYAEGSRVRCPYGQPGDRLWVRETWAKALHGTGCKPFERWEPGHEGPYGIGAIYKATPHDGYSAAPWRPSIHMPRWASRITLEVVDVRVERLQEITEAEAHAEGVEESVAMRGMAYAGRLGFVEPARWHSPKELVHGIRGAFASAWDTLNYARGFGWDANPWVWVIEFSPALPTQGALKK